MLLASSELVFVLLLKNIMFRHTVFTSHLVACYYIPRRVKSYVKSLGNLRMSQKFICFNESTVPHILVKNPEA